jgi:hypothetical protein
MLIRKINIFFFIEGKNFRIFKEKEIESPFELYQAKVINFREYERIKNFSYGWWFLNQI